MLTEVFIDGACRNNGNPALPNFAACAVVIYQNRQEVVRIARGLGDRTNNEAEYEALIHALLICSVSYIDPVIFSDSALVVNQTNGTWKCLNQSLFPFYKTVQDIKAEYNFQLVHVPRKFVRVADRLCNTCLDELEQMYRPIPNT